MEVTEWWLLLPRKVHVLSLLSMLTVSVSSSKPVEVIMTVHTIIGQLVSVCQHLAQRKGKNVNEASFIPVTGKKIWVLQLE